MTKKLVLGCCSTGAKYTPQNHRSTGDALLDRICTGADIPVSFDQVETELQQLDALGCRYYHYHARNPDTAEQTTDNRVYRVVGELARRLVPNMMLSYGASRNGPEVVQRIEQFGEWERISQAALPLEQGGAHFITLQAAIELQILRDLEQQTEPVSFDHVSSNHFLDQIRNYGASKRVENVTMETNSTANGANYGRSSPASQMLAYQSAIDARRRLNLLHEVEWVQFVRSYAMTRFAIERPELSLASSGQLNVTILFGFSPKLPFPQTYAEFRHVIQAAKRLERDADGRKCRNVTISVGAAVLPHHAIKHFGRFDEGRRPRAAACAVQRLIAYAAREDSEVDILRVGMEDTPYTLDQDGQLRPTTNVELVARAAETIDQEGATLTLDSTPLAKPFRAPTAIMQNLAA